MNRLLICLLFVGLAAKAQVSYDAIKRSDAWLTSLNAAALTRYSASNAAQAELSLTKAKGGFTDFSDSPDVLQGDAAVEAFYRLSSRTVFYGAMSYDNFSGKDMAGSTFISDFRPHTSDLILQTSYFRHLPFDIIEDSLNNTGTKHRDTYHLTGGFGYSVSNGFSVGARLDYTAANYAKYKDLRHKNKLMDMTFSASVFTPIGRLVQIGATYIYRRTTESVLFSTYGKGGRNFVSFINYGPYIGQTEQFGSTGFTDKSREMPLVDDYNGACLQFSIGHSPALQFYNAMTYAHRRGYYGRRSPYTITFTRHKSHVYKYDARLSHQSEKARFFLNFSLSAENLENLLPSRLELKNEAGATYYEYFTPVKSANRLWVDGQASLRADVSQLSSEALTTPGSMSVWSFEGGLRWAHHKQTAYLFPYYRRQHYTGYEPFISLTRNIATQKGVWTAQAGASFRHGDGTPADDGTFIEPSDKQMPPPTMDTYFWRDYQWMNAAQYEVGASGQYAFIMPSTSMKTYVRIALSHRKCNERNEYMAGPDRTTATLTLGCEF
ncbi:MAG: hypothetical protein J6V97_09135 [Prevotella sp.]|nr:hypothetical protein [Prevotella sp.]